MKKLLSLGLACWLVSPLIGCASQQGGYGDYPAAKPYPMARKKSMRGGFVQQEAPPAATPQDLLSAAARGDANQINALLSHGINVNSRNPNGAEALQLAAAGGFLPAVQDLLAGGADVNAADYNGTTALMAATQGGFDDVARALKAAGARGAKPAQQPPAADTGDQWWKK